MIEKIKNQNQIARHKLAEKINELIDVVNVLIKENNIHEKQIDSLQMDIRPILEERKSEIKIYEEIIQSIKKDSYAEQRKWVGKLCWFWDEKRVNAVVGVLTDFEIDEPHFRMNGLGWYEFCEPVKPDDNIIYKEQ